VNAPVVNGWKLSHKHDRALLPNETPDRDAGLLLKAGPVAASADATSHVVEIYNQGGIGACTGNGTAGNVRAGQHLAGIALPPSIARLWAYWLGRLYAHDTANDDGAQIRDVVAGLVKYGLCPETVWPYDEGTFRGPPPAEAWRAAYDFRIVPHKITSTGRGLIDDCKRAIASGRLVTFGSAVSNDYCNNSFDPTKPLAPPVGSEIAGLHCENLVAYSGDSFKVLNSWGSDWGDGGYATFSSDFLLDSNSRDFWVLDLVPTTPVVDAGGAP
jgi:hypothetical protein